VILGKRYGDVLFVLFVLFVLLSLGTLPEQSGKGGTTTLLRLRLAPTRLLRKQKQGGSLCPETALSGQRGGEADQAEPGLFRKGGIQAVIRRFSLPR
jgi:hypothetical protein